MNIYKEVFDVVVVGGGLGGIVAAIAASRSGCKTVLIHDRPVLGGNSSSEIHVYPYGSGRAGIKRHLRETGIVEEIKQENRYRNPNDTRSIWSMILWEYITREKNISLFLNSRVFEVKKHSPKRIKGVSALQITTNKRLFFEGDIFIDTSGDGVVGYLAKAEFREGREAANEFNEDLAPEKQDKYVLPGCLLFQIENVGKPVPFTPPSWARHFPKDEDLPFRTKLRTPYSHGFWWLEWGGKKDNNLEIEEIRDELLKILMGVWDHMKNHGDHRVENHAISWIQSVVGKRESRRLVGDYMLTQNDIEQPKLFHDRVAYGGWPIDIHPPNGIYSKGSLYYISKNAETPYSIPFRCLYSKNIDNLMFAGRCISVTHVALGSTRVMSTCAAQGQAVGLAAYLCKRYKIIPRKIYEKHISELQQLLLKNDNYIIGIRNEDKHDLARKAKVSASSVKILSGMIRRDDEKPLDKPRAEMFYLSEDRLEYVDVLLKSKRIEPVEITMRLCRGKTLLGFSESMEIASSTTVIAPNKCSWSRFQFNQSVAPGLYWIWLSSCEKISWRFSNDEEWATNCARFDKEQNIWLPERGDYCFRISPKSKVYDAENITSGVTRPEQISNVWCSDPNLSLPQYVILDFRKEKKIDTIYITFDTNLSESSDRTTEKGFVPLISTTKPVNENCVKDYSILYWGGKQWKKILDVVGNYHRHRIHHFDTVITNRIKIKISATNGAPYAVIYEVRSYLEGQ